jgi:hypothetical protein
LQLRERFLWSTLSDECVNRENPCEREGDRITGECNSCGSELSRGSVRDDRRSGSLAEVRFDAKARGSSLSEPLNLTHERSACGALIFTSAGGTRAVDCCLERSRDGAKERSAYGVVIGNATFKLRLRTRRTASAGSIGIIKEIARPLQRRECGRVHFVREAPGDRLGPGFRDEESEDEFVLGGIGEPDRAARIRAKLLGEFVT